MAQSPGQNKNKWLEIIVIVGSLLGLGLLVGFVIFLLIQQQYVPAIVLGGFTFVVLVVLIFLGYTSPRFEWIGIGKYKTPDGSYHRPRTFWDWVQLLIIPAVLVSATIFFNNAQTQNSINAAQDQQHEDILVNYQKDISDLLLTQQSTPDISTQQGTPDTSKERIVFRAVARARTLTALSVLDPKRKGLLVQFLYDAQLIITRHPTVDLSNADLSNTDLNGAHLNNVNLSGANLSGADLRNAFLIKAYLDGTDLTGTKLDEADLSGAYLWNADLSGVDLSGTKLSETGPNGTLLSADLSDTKLCGTKLGKHQSEPGVSLTRAIMKNCPTNAMSLPYTVCRTQSSNLENDPAQWQNSFNNINVQKAQGEASESIVDEPNFLNTNNKCINKALQISLLSGSPPSYTGVQAYRNLIPKPDCTGLTFDLSLHFYVTDVAPIQALAFSMQQWVENQEWQWAMQWQQNGDGIPPDWRIWTVKSSESSKQAIQAWQDVSSIKDFKDIISPDLTERTWHFIDLQGKIDIGNVQDVQYLSFTYDTHTDKFNNNGGPFPPVTYQPSNNYNVTKLVAAVELDGNSQEDPYDVYIDNVSLTCK